ncbi:MAG: gliding motility-associated ABC transporter permease subunit GldF [Bacteroidota bacterium]|nr:gliding motility-associated ABC transporter permease subunit GldF [Bacteroidota bacterium]
MLPIFYKEIRSFFNSLIAYLTIGVFLIASGLFMWVFPDNILEYGFAEMDIFFSNAPYIFMFLIPAITMRSFAEENKTGTIELLITKPLTELEIILGKYLASFALVLFSLIPTLVFYYTLYTLGSPKGNLDTAGIIGSYIGLFFLGGLFAALGICASSLFDNQVTAFIVSLFMCYLFYNGFGYLASMNTWGKYTTTVEQLGIAYHYNSLSKGLIDSKDVIYFLSIIAIALGATKLSIQSRNWV